MLESVRIAAWLVALCAAGWAGAAHAEPVRETVAALRADAAEAARSGDVEGARRALLANAALQPGHPWLLVQQAALDARAGDVDALAARLHALADTGATRDVAGLREAFGELADQPAVSDALARLVRNAQPVGRLSQVARVTDASLLSEGVARASDGRLFVSSVAQRRVLVGRERGGFGVFADTGLGGVFGMAADEARGLLWLATGVAPQTLLAADTPRASALVALDLETGAERARLVVPAGGRIADLALAPDGSVYAADADQPVIYRAAGPDGALTVFTRSDLFYSLQGLVWTQDALYAADYGRGLFRIDARGGVRTVAQPHAASLIGLDGLSARGAQIIAVQNGFSPARLVALTLNADGDAVTEVSVLASGHAELIEPTLGVVDADRFIFVADAQWAVFDPEAQGAEARPLTLMSVALP